jgi:hypothetical protein
MLKKSRFIPLFMFVSLGLSACGAESSTSDSDIRPLFSRASISPSGQYQPSGIITDTTPSFSWPATVGATSYFLGLEDTDTSKNWQMYTLTADQANCATHITCSYTPNNLALSTTDEKAWWVKPIIPGKATDWSNTHVFKFRNTSPVSSSRPLSPSGEKTVTSLKPSFTWTPAGSNTNQYELGYENNSGSNWISYTVAADQANCSQSQCSYEIVNSPLKHGSINTWWVRSRSNGIWSDWSIGSTFNVDTSVDPADLLTIKNDETGETQLYPGLKDVSFIPRYSNGKASSIWGQGFTILDNGFYLMSKNIKEKNSAGSYKDRYISFNLFDKKGQSVANAQLDYSSHGQDLSIEKLSNNHYYVYTSKFDGKGISRFSLDTSNVNFNNPTYVDALLDITLDKDFSSTAGTHTTPALNVEKTKFATVSYKSSNVLYVQTYDKGTHTRLKKFELDLNNVPNGFYNQGVAMKGDFIYILRGHWLTDGDHNTKKLYVLNATTGERVSTYSFSLQNASSYERIEPEGLVIIKDQLFVMLPTRKQGKRVMKLYPLLRSL